MDPNPNINQTNSRKKTTYKIKPINSNHTIAKNQQKSIPSPSIHKSIEEEIRERIEENIRCGRACQSAY
jgi:hypothetical protein